MSIKINMLYSGEEIKGQGVLSATLEQNKICLHGLCNDFCINIKDKKYDHDIFHIFTIDNKFYKKFKKYKKHGILIGHCYFLPETLEANMKLPSRKKTYYKLIKNFYKNCDYIVTVNPAFIDKLAKYGIDKNRITFIPNYVDKELFYKLEAPKEKYRKIYNIDSSKFTVLVVGQIQKKKGIFDFIDIARRMPDIQFVWAGECAYKSLSKDNKEIEELIKNPPENVKFIGYIDRSIINQVYNMADILLLPSHEDLFPMPILEAFCIGLPVVTRNLEYFDDILYGFVSTSSTTSDFINEIRKLKDDKEYYEQCSENSRKGHQFYNKDIITNMWNKYYKQVYERDKNKVTEPIVVADLVSHPDVKEKEEFLPDIEIN